MAIGEVVVRVGADTTRLQRNLKKSADDLKNFGGTVAKIGTANKLLFAGLAATAAASIGGIVKVASNYESAFAGVRKTTEATEAQFAELSKGIRDMAKEIPASTEEIARVAEVAGQLGIKRKDMLDFTRVMMDLGVATTMSAGDAATALARFANITGMPMDNVERLGSTVVHLGNNLAATEEEIVNMGLRLAGAGNQARMSESEILAFAGALSSVGIRAEAGGSAFSRVFLNMNTAVKSGGEILDKFAKVAGVSSAEFKQAFEKDASQAVLSFIKGLDRIDKSGGDVASVLGDMELGEIRVRDALMRAAGASNVFSDALEWGNSAWEDNTALTNEAQERYNTFASKVTVLKNRIKDFVLIFGAPLLDVFSNAVDALDPFLRVLESLAAKFENADNETKYMIAKFVALIPVVLLVASGVFAVIASIGAFLAVAGKMAAVFGITASAMLALIGSITGIIILIPVVIALAVAIVKNWDVVKAKTIELVGVMGAKLRELPSILADVARRVGGYLRELIPEPVVNFIEDMIGRISSAFSNVVGAIKSAMTGDFESVGNLFVEFIPSIVGLLIGGLPRLAIVGAKFLPALADGILKNKDKIDGTVVPILTGFLEGLTESFPKILDAGVRIIESLLDGIISSMPFIVQATADLITEIIKAISTYLPTIIEAGITVVQTLIDGVIMALPFIIEAIMLLIEAITVTVALLLPLIVHMGIEILMALVEGIVEMLPVLIDTAMSLITSLLETIVDLLPTILEAGMDILFAIIDGIVETLPQLIDAVNGLVSSFLDTLITQLPKLMESGAQMLLSLITGIINVLPDLLIAAVLLITSLIVTIVTMLPRLIIMGIELIWALIKGIGQTTGKLLSAGFELIGKLLAKIAEFVPKLLDAGVKLINSLITGALSLLKNVGKAALDIGKKLLGGIGGVAGDMISLGGDLIGGMVKGITDMKDKAVKKAKEIGGAIKNTLTSFFGIFSPSRVMDKDVGKMLGLGLINGMDSQISSIKRTAKSISEAATPEQPKLAALDVANMEGKARQWGSEMRVTFGGEDGIGDSGTDNTVLEEIRDELRNQKKMIVEMDGRAVGKAVRPHINEDNAMDESFRYFG